MKTRDRFKYTWQIANYMNEIMQPLHVVVARTTREKIVNVAIAKRISIGAATRELLDSGFEARELTGEPETKKLESDLER